MRWTLYLDLDDTIFIQTNPVHNSAAFFHWCKKHFDIRWLTRWCPDGKMNPDQINYLSKHLNVPKEEFPKFNNPLGFKWSKTEAVDWAGNKPWIWVENDLFPHEKPLMETMMKNYFGNEEHFYRTNLHYWDLTPNEPQAANGPENAIYRTWTKIAKDFKLPMT
jgi:hypothetical protein